VIDAAHATMTSETPAPGTLSEGRERGHAGASGLCNEHPQQTGYDNKSGASDSSAGMAGSSSKPEDDRRCGDKPIGEILAEIRFDSQLTPSQKQTLEDLISRYAKAFGYANARPADLPMLRTRLVQDFEVVRHLPARLPAKKREIVRKWVEAMVKAGLYVRCDNNSWASRVTVVPKADGTWRVCGNYVDVNEQCESDAGPMPNHREKMSTFRGCRFFAVFDLENGYLQGSLDEVGRRVFAMITDEGVFCPQRVPYGVKNAPVWFHNAVARVVAGIPCCESMFDDVCVAAPDFERFVAHLEEFLKRAVEHNLKLKAKKAVIGSPCVRFVGRIIGGDRIEVDRERVTGLVDAGPPQDRATLHSYLSSVNWLSMFLPALAAIAAPLWALMKKNAEFRWTDECQRSFEAIRRIIAEPQWLEHPEPDATLVLRTDACARGIAGALLQVHHTRKGANGIMAIVLDRLPSTVAN